MLSNTEVDLDRTNVGEVLAWMETNNCEEFSFKKTRELKETQTIYVSKEELLSVDKNTDFYDVSSNKDWEGHLYGSCWDGMCYEVGNESEEYSSYPTITQKGGEEWKPESWYAERGM
jgi:hypothetical protein